MSGILTIPAREAMMMGGVLGAVGISFVFLRVKRYIRFGDE
jgi:hypothetical protein